METSNQNASSWNTDNQNTNNQNTNKEYRALTAIEKQIIAEQARLRAEKAESVGVPSKQSGVLSIKATSGSGFKYSLHSFLFITLGTLLAYTHPLLPEAASKLLPASQPANTAKRQRAGDVSQPVMPDSGAQMSELQILAAPIDKLTLEEKPDLFRRHVQVYRATLAKNPENRLAKAKLNLLLDQSLQELETAVETERYSLAEQLFTTAYSLFPELTKTSRYLSLIHNDSHP